MNHHPAGLRIAAVLLLAALLRPTPARAAEAPGVGYIRTSYQQFEVSLLPAKPSDGDANGGKALNVVAVDGRAAVLAGEYYISNWKVEGDADGHHWYAKGNMLPEPITVRAGEELKVRIAQPLQAHLIVYGAQDPIGFRLELTGPYGERCREIRRDGQYIPQPQLDILDGQGRLVERITFAGRCGGTCLTTWSAPKSLKGKFTALPNADFGPLAVEVGAGTSFFLEASRLSMPKAVVGQPAPEFTLTGSDATLNQLSFMRGRPVILCFFCGCGLCKAVATELGKHPDLTKRAHLLAVFSDPSYGVPSYAESYQKETGYPGRMLLDLAATTTLQYQSAECPRLWVIDATGVARHATADRLSPAPKIVDDAVKALRK